MKTNRIKIRSGQKGFTLAELLVGVAVFLVIIVSVYNSYMSIFDVVKASRAKIEAVNLINEELEIVRNLPYADVGIDGGIPDGVLSHVKNFTRGGYNYVATTTIRNIDDPFDGTLGSSPNDLSPADYKLAEIEVGCLNCKNFIPITITTKVSPKNLETASTNGALFIKVFNANGNPISDASVHIENNLVNPPIRIDDVTNNNGILQIVDATPGVNAYEITVNKSGYSKDKTYPISVSNPNPTKPHSTVLLQQVTQTSFSIDQLGILNFSSVNDSCSPVSSIDFSLKGSKLIGTPSVFKYSTSNTTNSSGNLTLNNMEWDTYSLNLTDTDYDLAGMNPPSPFSLNPGNTQNIQMIVVPKNPNFVLITTRDSSTNLPLSGVSVTLTKTGYSNTKITGQGFISQTDWSGGGGQSTSTDKTKYFSSDGNIENNNPAGDIVLKKILGNFVSSGILESSTFDTGSLSNFQEIGWKPVDQPLSTGNPNVRFQIATNNNGYDWNYYGPDGTTNSYYSKTEKVINNINNNNRYLRYKVFLNTSATSSTPNISDVSFTYTTSCTPQGQVFFNGLSSGTYTVTLTRDGYEDKTGTIDITSTWQSKEFVMTPN